MQAISAGSTSRTNYEDRTQDRLVETKVVYRLTFVVKETILKSAILKQNHVSPMIWGLGIRSQASGGFLGMALLAALTVGPGSSSWCSARLSPSD